MAHTAPTVETADDASGLLSLARQQGQRDVYAGKRGWIRYTLGMRTEVTTDPTIPFASWSVTTHNVSGGGIGFWSRRPLEGGTPVHILDLSDKNDPVWIPATVMHCTMGIRGYLLGARFESPAPDPDGAAAEADLPQDQHVLLEEVARRCTKLPPLSQEFGAAVAGAALLASVAACSIAWFLVGHLGLWLSLLVAVLLTGFFGGLGGRRIARGMSRFMTEFQRALTGMTVGRRLGHDVPDVSIRELASLRHTLLELEGRARRREDGQRIQRQKLEEVNQMKGNLIAIVSHDLRTPLTSILLYANMLREDMESLSDADRHSFLKIIADECTRLSRLVDELLEVQRLEFDLAQWNLKEMDISELVRSAASVFEPLAQGKSIELSLQCPAQLPAVVADADKMLQVLSNLVSNAIKYADDGGRVEVSAITHGKEVLLRVADDGPGVPRDMWDSIFDRFSQIRDPDVSEIAGVGLGLYIVRKIVEGHGGCVWVDSEVGGGSKFYVSLPVRHDSPENPAEVVSGGPTGRVLVCDSDPQLVAVMGQFLKQQGHEVRTAHSGKRLLEHLAQGGIDVVVSDVLLPDMDADQLLNGVCSMTPRAFKLIVHSYADDGHSLRHAGIDVFLQRPASQKELLRIVAEIMEKRSSEPRSGAAAAASRGC